jgi:N-methylhydantoinase A/oxoprolinase/acetone carboxylase beta subunit
VQEHWGEALEIDRLERAHLVHHCGPTPPDVLPAAGLFQRWNTAAAERVLDVLAGAVKMDRQRLIARVMQLAERGVAMEVLKKQLDSHADAEGIERSRSARALLDNWLSGGSSDYEVRVRVKHPIIGIGAPIAHFLPAAARLLETEAIIPEHADVANAIGAITSSVMIRRQMEISPEIDGRFALHGAPGTPVFADMESARAKAVELLRATVTQAAREAGTSHGRIRISFHDRIAPLGDGSQAFVGQTIEARLTGRPDLARLAVSL